MTTNLEMLEARGSRRNRSNNRLGVHDARSFFFSNSPVHLDSESERSLLRDLLLESPVSDMLSGQFMGKAEVGRY